MLTNELIKVKQYLVFIVFLIFFENFSNLQESILE